ncbi:MAG: helix-turn-helix domain-containing protein [Candidatus Latescibacterota bacterium]|nr:helix-turn-helix domain-containing protein [Candidatus Latescibacterota bacterium]
MSKRLTKKGPVEKRLLWMAKNGVDAQVGKTLVQNKFVTDRTVDMDRTLALLDQISYDFVIYDIRGFSDDPLPNIGLLVEGGRQVIAVNGKPLIPWVVKAIRAGALDYLPAPLMVDQLLEIISVPVKEEFLYRGHNDPVVDHIFAHAPAIKTREEVALRFGISANTVSSRVRAVASTTFTDFLHVCRLRGARCLLETTSLNISQISARVGFSTPEHFSRIFSRHVGQSPARYRLKRRSVNLVS